MKCMMRVLEDKYWVQYFRNQSYYHFLQNCGKLPQKARKKDALTQRERFPSLNVHLCGVSVI